MSRLEQQITEMLAPTIEGMGFELVGIEYVRAGKHSTLRVYIDHLDGINVDNCADVSHQVSAILDVEDPIATEYYLEVSSPGADRRLFKPQHYQAYLGEKVTIKLSTPIAGRRNFAGELQACDDQQVIIKVDGIEHVLMLANIEKANLIPKYDI